ncbi:uncharacterized protein [Mytilus edulis]|uniref:uncharacterized protein n=1 Tax=Mytilus edulis TaxID=6550 RepID=UPI0039F0505F
MSVVLFQRGGWTALMMASWYGHLEICRLLIDTGCKIDITDVSGETALIFAAREGHLEICRLLIARGFYQTSFDVSCIIPAGFDTNIRGDVVHRTTKKIFWGSGVTVLMLAAQRGDLEICRLLIDRGCKIDITDILGYTALHKAAGEGHLQITRCLVKRGGASTLVTTHKGQTPYDLAAERMKEEVMEYLQTVMSEKSSGVTAEQGREGDMVPTEIKLMADKRSIDMYLKLLQSGYELKRDIRLVVVGKKGAGKTSLIRRLFGEEITDVTSTNGIEIHKIQCKAMSDDGIWNKQEENYEDTQTQARLLKQYVGKLQDKRPIQKPIESHRDFKDNTSVTSFDESKKSETASKLIIKPPEVAEPQSEPQVTPQQPSEQAARDFENMLTAQSKVDVNDTEEYATFFLWDFAGDEEFYHTHQTFLSQDAMYLVVTKLNEADDHNAQALFRLWINSIHCYSRLEEINNTSDKKPLGDNDPPVVIVGTWKDAVTSETDTRKIEIACKENLLKYTNELADDERRHVRCKYFISNKDDECSTFQQIRQQILNLARGMRTWNIKYPSKFIQLEQRLQEKKKDLPIISYQKIKDFSTDIPEPLNEEELKFFLEFHHELRGLVYFKDLPDNIIINTQWLADAFKCIVTAEKFQASTTNQKKWNEFYHTGKLNYEVLEDIFKKETTILYKHKNYILKVMEKFDIIIRPNKSEGADENPFYYVPCMIKAEPDRDIYEMFNITEDIGQRSTWFCFKFKFLPPHLMNHLISSLSRKYTVAEVIDSKKKTIQIALFKGTAVFEIDKKLKLRKLLVKTYPSLILIQVLEYVKESNRGVYKNIIDFVTDKINKIISFRFQMSNVKFEKKWECGLTEPDLVKGRNDFSIKHGTTYFCENCRLLHHFTDEWSDPSSPPKSKEVDPGLTSDKEGTMQTNSILENPYKSSKTASELASDIEGTTQTNIIPEKLPMNFEAVTGLTSDIQVTTQTNIIPLTTSYADNCDNSTYILYCLQPPKSLEVAIELTSDIGGTTKTGIIPENPLKSSTAASGFSTNTECTSLTGIISKNKQKGDYKSTIKDKYDFIVQQKLDISGILDQMMTRLVISVDDRRNIEHDKMQNSQTKALLDIVIERGGTTNNMFIDVLQECGYNELADNLTKVSVNDSLSSKSDLEKVPAYKIRLQKNYLEIINRLKHSDQ